MLILQSNKRFFYKKHIKKYHGSCFWVAFQNDAVLCAKKICQIAEPHYPGPFTMQSYQDRPTPTRTYLAFKQHHGPFPQVSLKVAPHKPSWKTTKTTWWLQSWRPLSAVLKMARTAGQLIGWHRSTTTLASTLHISSPCTWQIRDMWWYAICPKQELTKFVVGHQLSYSKFRKICEFAGPFSWTWLPVFIWAVLGDFKWFLKRRQETLDKWRELRVLLQLFALALSRGPRNNTVQAWLSVVHPEPNDKVGQTPRNYRETSKTCGMYRNIYVCVIVFMIK